VPAATVAVLWQTRSDTDAFCLGELHALAGLSEALHTRDSTAGYVVTLHT
jgi:hypothetical protein